MKHKAVAPFRPSVYPQSTRTALGQTVSVQDPCRLNAGVQAFLRPCRETRVLTNSGLEWAGWEEGHVPLPSWEAFAFPRSPETHATRRCIGGPAYNKTGAGA